MAKKEYIERDSIIKAVVIQQDKERKGWMEHLQQLRGTKDYSSREIAVDNWLRGYNESVQYLVAKTEEMTADDVVEVVRCKDCKYWTRDGNGYCDDESSCTNPDGLDNYAKPDDYCSYGERKDGAGND